MKPGWSLSKLQLREWKRLKIELVGRPTWYAFKKTRFLNQYRACGNNAP